MVKTPPTIHRFNRLVILRNPNSTRAKDDLGLVATLRKHFDEANTTEFITSVGADDWLRLAHEQKLLGDQTLLAVIAGDGTLNKVVEALFTEKTLNSNERKTVLLPLWGGNANDLARMLNGMPSRMRINQLMKSGAVVAVRPIDFTLTPRRGEVQRRLALCYASFGASASVAKAINDSAFRKITLKTLPVLRFGRELMLVITTLGQAPRFRLQDDGKKEQRIYERVFLNGSRLAKVERVALKLTAQQFYQTDVARMRLGALFSRALELSDRRFEGRVAQTQMKFTLYSTILAQFDGEHVSIKAGTTVDARVHDIPFYALSIRMKK